MWRRVQELRNHLNQHFKKLQVRLNAPFHGHGHGKACTHIQMFWRRLLHIIVKLLSYLFAYKYDLCGNLNCTCLLFFITKTSLKRYYKIEKLC